MAIKIYTLTSSLHDAAGVDGITREFLASLGLEYTFKGNDFSDYGRGGLDLIYVRTGGTEGIFQGLLPSLPKDRPFYLLTSGKSNSLAASMEILSYLNLKGLKGEILHGSGSYLNKRICLIYKALIAAEKLRGQRLAVIGKPSDWLISSNCDYALVKEKLGIELIDIPMQRLLDTISAIPEGECGEYSTVACKQGREAAIKASLPMADRIYRALRRIIDEEKLDGLTIRCFDLLTAVKNTGCLALARLNSEGFTATCEGDVPAMLSMAVSRAVSGCSGFQCNASVMDPETRRILFAHCTLPLNMASSYNFDTHFESGIGVGIHGEILEGDACIFKLAPDCRQYFVSDVKILRNEYGDNLCRTQILVELPEGSDAISEYFLKKPIGNHHIVIPDCDSLTLVELFRLQGD